MENNQPLGVFDSGVGGLTVVKSLWEHFPNEQIIYFGDTAHPVSYTHLDVYKRQMINFRCQFNGGGFLFNGHFKYNIYRRFYEGGSLLWRKQEGV